MSRTAIQTSGHKINITERIMRQRISEPSACTIFMLLCSRMYRLICIFVGIELLQTMELRQGTALEIPYLRNTVEM